jgi:2,3-dihydroxybenzoate-AMP ligase
MALVASGVRQTYRDLDDISAALGAALGQRGIGPLDRVLLQLPNIPAFVHYYLALVRIGAIPVLAMPAHRETEVRHFIRSSGAVAYILPDVIRDYDYRPVAEKMQQEFVQLESVIVVGSPAEGQISHDELRRQAGGAATFHSGLDQGNIDASEAATFLLTGGTTSLPKLIPRTHQDYALNARLCGKAAGFDAATVFMAILPLAHNYNLASPGILATFIYGGTVVLPSSPEMADVFSVIEREGVTTVAAAVPLIARWLAQPEELKGYDTSSLQSIQNGGATLPPELRRRMTTQLGCKPQEIYGTAEGLINMTRLDDPEEVLLHGSGSPVCDADEIKVVDEAGNEVPDGEPGELLVRGPYTIRGYYNAPEKNAGAFTADGFYRMGDIVHKHDRQIYAAGRIKDVINRGGEKISCEEVEDLIIRHPGVRAVSLVAMPDPVYGEKACAFVILKEGRTLTFEALKAFLMQSNVAKFKLPERLEVVEQFPLSPVGKILKKVLRDRIAEKIALERQPCSRADFR